MDVFQFTHNNFSGSGEGAGTMYFLKVLQSLKLHGGGYKRPASKVYLNDNGVLIDVATLEGIKLLKSVEELNLRVSLFVSTDGIFLASPN